jgi:hypothetical protein
MPLKSRLHTAALGAVLLAAGLPARAGSGHDNCVGFIDALPAAITKSGTWCLRRNLATTLNSGGVISIHANNVTLDCNGFSLVHETPANEAGAIVLSGANNVTRNCEIRGFYQGVHAYGPGNFVEDNRFLQIGQMAMYVQGEGSVIRRNHVFQVGNHPLNNGALTAVVAYGSGDVIDNVIDTLTPTVDTYGAARPTALYLYIIKGEVRGNRIRNLVPQGAGGTVGIESWGGEPYIRRNHIVGPGLNQAGHLSIRCAGGGEQFARDNIASGFAYTWTSGSSGGFTGSITSCYTLGGSNIDKL